MVRVFCMLDHLHGWLREFERQRVPAGGNNSRGNLKTISQNALDGVSDRRSVENGLPVPLRKLGKEDF